jgi:hypothetical protein
MDDNELKSALHIGGDGNVVGNGSTSVVIRAESGGTVNFIGPSSVSVSANGAAIERLSRLDELEKGSRARCIARWQAAGIPRSEAILLADDLTVGSPGPVLQPSPEKLLLLITGELGMGKSLIAERLLQAAIAKARESVDAPVPIWLEASLAAGRLRDAVQEGATGLANPHIQGATIVIDGADEAGIGSALELLAEARVLVGTWPNTTIVITCRPLPSLASSEEVVQVPYLSERETRTLVGRVAGWPLTEGMLGGWSSPIRDSIRRPLFAILLGTHLRDYDMNVPRSTGELLTSLVERSLGRIHSDKSSTSQLLQRLARLSTDRNGGLVPAGEVASRAEQQGLLDSRLVAEKMGSLVFPLAILTQWFAAQSLAAGDPTPDALVSDSQRLERWRYPLIIFVSTFGHERVSKLLVPLAARYPAFAAGIVEEGLGTWGLAEEVLPPPQLECAQRIRTTMQAWSKGIGPLARLIAPVRGDGTLLPIGVRTREAWLTTAWYRGDSDMPEIVPLPHEASFFSNQPVPGWVEMRSARPGRQAAWAWRWTFNELVTALSRLLSERDLPMDDGPLAREWMWQVMLAVTGRRRSRVGPIPLTEIEQRLLQLPKDAVAIRLGRCKFVPAYVWREVNRLRENAKTELCAPWPEPDRETFGSSWIWDPYSPGQMLARAKAVYAGALDGYEQLVRSWFPSLAPRLEMAATLPARLVGVITPPRPGSGLGSGPTIGWYFQALPRGKQSTVDFQLGEGMVPVDSHSVLGQLHSLRPEVADWIGATVWGGYLDIFGSSPATELAYHWLWDDLKKISWVDGLLGSPPWG